MIYIIANCSIYLTTFSRGYYVVELDVVAGKTFRLCLQSHKTQLLQLLQLVIGVQWLLLLHLQLFDAHAHTANSHTVIHNTLTITLTQCKLDHLVLAACIQLHFVLLQLLSRFAAQWGRQMAREEGVMGKGRGG